MNSSQNFFERYRFPLFFLLSYVLSWWALPVTRQGQLAQGVPFAALIVIALTAGRKGLREWWGRLTNFRGGWWYLIGPVILAGALAVAFVLNVLLGASVAGGLQFPIEAVVILLFLGGAWEEPGWSGYALPALQKRYANTPNGALIATLVLGVFRGLWHLPLVLVGAIPWYDAVVMTPFVFQPIISWLYNRSRGSVPVIFVFHYSSNLLGAITGALFQGADVEQYRILYYAFGLLAAIVIAWKSGFKFGYRGEQAEAVGAEAGARARAQASPTS